MQSTHKILDFPTPIPCKKKKVDLYNVLCANMRTTTFENGRQVYLFVFWALGYLCDSSVVWVAEENANKALQEFKSSTQFKEKMLKQLEQSSPERWRAVMVKSREINSKNDRKNAFHLLSLILKVQSLENISKPPR
jgi:hypothetical protein